MDIISKEMLTNPQDGKLVSGYILCRNYNVSYTKNNKEYILGTLQNDAEISFKVWDSSEAFPIMRESQLMNTVIYIEGVFNNYNNMYSVLINRISVPVEPVDISSFMPSKYNVDMCLDCLKAIVKANVTEKGLAIANKNLFDNQDLIDEFKIEFAAAYYHDNCKGGLIAHTYKVILLTVHILDMYKSFVESSDAKDIIILGALFHDIGKIKEMHFGVYTPEAKVTHRYLGIEMIDRESFIEAYGEDGWYELVSVFLQHHGEFEDNCRTLSAYIVHKADCLDAEMTLIEQTMNTVQPQNGIKFINIGKNTLQAKEWSINSEI